MVLFLFTISNMQTDFLNMVPTFIWILKEEFAVDWNYIHQTKNAPLFEWLITQPTKKQDFS